MFGIKGGNHDGQHSKCRRKSLQGREKSWKEESQEIFQYHGDGIRGDRYNRDHDHGCDGFETWIFILQTGLLWHLALWYYIQV